MRVLLVEDEPDMSVLVAGAVAAAGFTVDRVHDLGEAEAAVMVARYAVVLLDRRLPDGDGLSLVRTLRRDQPGAPILVLSALDAVPERIRGLDQGADDYLTKPFDMDELVARIRAALRGPGAGPPPPMRCGRLTFDLQSREVVADGVALPLKRRELALLESLIRRTGRVVQRSTLSDEVYGFDDDIQSNTLDSHVSRLRARLIDANAGVVIHPVRGVGYILDRAC